MKGPAQWPKICGPAVLSKSSRNVGWCGGHSRGVRDGPGEDEQGALARKETCGFLWVLGWPDHLPTANAVLSLQARSDSILTDTSVQAMTAVGHAQISPRPCEIGTGLALPCPVPFQSPGPR